MNSKLRDILDELTNPLVDVRTHLYLPDHKIAKAEKAIRQAVGEEMLELLPKKSHTAQKAYRVESNDYVSVVEEKAANKKLDQVRQKIKEWSQS